MLKPFAIKSAIATAASAISCLTISAMAHAETAPAPVCPASYESIGDGLCFKQANGDIVLAEAPGLASERQAAASGLASERQAAASGLVPQRQQEASAAKPTCPQGYSILLETLCFSDRTGDIVLAEEAAASAVQTARK